MDEYAEEVIRPELGPNERLLWSGRPPQGIKFRSIDVFLIPFSLLWAGFAFFWEGLVIVGGAPWFFALWGVPFLIAGLYFTVGRFWFESRQRANVYYGVTNQRLIIVHGVLVRNVRSCDLDTLTDLVLTANLNGSGIITFGPLPQFYSWHGGPYWPWFGSSPHQSFDLPSDARQAYEIIRDAQRAVKQLGKSEGV